MPISLPGEERAQCGATASNHACGLARAVSVHLQALYLASVHTSIQTSVTQQLVAQLETAVQAVCLSTRSSQRGVVWGDRFVPGFSWLLTPCAHHCCFWQKHAAALYAQAADFNKTARFYYMKAQDAYYLANAQASYDDWRRARRQWDYFYRRK